MIRVLTTWLAVLLLAVGCAPIDEDGDGYVFEEDCDDGDAGVYPGAAEVCDGVDQDCNGSVDDGVLTTFYIDEDGDGFGSTTSALACTHEAGLADNALDCNDADEAVFPDAVELCNGIDDDCDASIDEDNAEDAPVWYADSDRDGFGDPAVTTRSCDLPDGYVSDNTDCDDTTDLAHPEATEVCDGLDNNCDGTVDEDTAADAPTWWRDADEDSFGVDGETRVQCADPGSGWVAPGTVDCDDASPAVFPGADELCNGFDDDCDGTIDEDDALDAPTWFADLDEDGFGDAGAPTLACSRPEGYLADDTDCDDTEASTYPGADETCDGEDDNCDGTVDEDDAIDAETWFADSDGDSFGDASTTTKACSLPRGYVADDTDCDDTEATTYPGADEYCDGHDDDCDGTVDEDDAVDAGTWYLDSDGDTYGDASVSTAACSAPTGYVADSRDCDDTDADINPDTVWKFDRDGDGYGDDKVTRTQCTSPGTGWTTTGGDCRPSDVASYPGAPEICVSGTRAEGIDNDCDGSVDETCPDIHCGTIVTSETWKKNTYGHLITCDVRVESRASPVLTIEAGADIKARGVVGILVAPSSNPGGIVIKGTTTDRVTMTTDKSSPTPGSWRGLFVGRSATSGSSITGLDIRYAGFDTGRPGNITLRNTNVPIADSVVRFSRRHGIYLDNARPEITDTEISDNTLDGVRCPSAICLDGTPDSFDGNTVTRNKGAALQVPAGAVHSLAESTTYTGNTDDVVVVPGGRVAQVRTWHDLGVPYRLTDDLEVGGSSSTRAELTLEDGVEIRVAKDKGIFVGQGYPGDLITEGTVAGDVLLTSDASTPAAGDWIGVVFRGISTGRSLLEGTEIAYAGSTSRWPGSITVSGTATPTVRASKIGDSGDEGIRVYARARFTLTDTVIEDSTSFGLLVDNGGELAADVEDCTLSGNNVPVRLPYRQAHRLDDTSTFTGNTQDAVQLTFDGNIDTAVTWAALDVPYRALRDVIVGRGSSRGILTLADGVRLRFDTGRALVVGSAGNRGDLVVAGDISSGKGVTLDSWTSGGPGTWRGILIGSGTTSRTVLEGLTLREGGSSTSDPGALHVDSGTVELIDSTIEDSEAFGIYVDSASHTSWADVTLTDTTVQDTVQRTSSSPDGDGVHLTDEPHHRLDLAGVTLTGNDRYPLVLHGEQLGGIESKAAGSDYSGNGDDRVMSWGGQVTRDATWADPGVPVYLSDHLYIGHWKSAPNTITATGITFEVAALKNIQVGWPRYGDLKGTSLTFTSAASSPRAGDWCGLLIDRYSTSATFLDKSTIRYAGRTSGCPYYSGGGWPGALGVRGAAGRFTNGTVSDSASSGIDLWSTAGFTVSGSTLEDNARYGIQCRSGTRTLSSNTFSGNGSGTTSGC